MKIAFCGFHLAEWYEGLRKSFKVDLVNIYKSLPNLESYDFIFVYLISGQKFFTDWTQIVPNIKRKYPDKPLMLYFDYGATIDAESANSQWIETFKMADIIGHSAPFNKLTRWHKWKDKCHFIPVPITYKNLYKIQPPVKVNFDKKWVAIMHHTNPWADLGIALKVLGQVGASVKFFTGWHGVNPKGNEIVAKSWGIKEVVAFPRMKMKDYLYELQKCYIGFDNCMGYVGWSRFIFQCAAYKIPVVANSYVGAGIANPDLVTDDEKKQAELIRKLLDNPKLRNEYGEKAYANLIKECNPLIINRKIEEILRGLKK